MCISNRSPQFLETALPWLHGAGYFDNTLMLVIPFDAKMVFCSAEAYVTLLLSLGQVDGLP
jgi:hypothetical protein